MISKIRFLTILSPLTDMIMTGLQIPIWNPPPAGPESIASASEISTIFRYEIIIISSLCQSIISSAIRNTLSNRFRHRPTLQGKAGALFSSVQFFV
jgi:hypothetical protein